MNERAGTVPFCLVTTILESLQVALKYAKLWAIYLSFNKVNLPQNCYYDSKLLQQFEGKPE